ncbi:hypothetical protein [Amycolatopsis sp. WQ 127309]|uniref:hypothetical protein n=1 Tax=Amycolatopsis sp. WQ 127309 TaxID=2932773 RepID=UPI001FF3282C|nr:hypothetical protein [Amycolatopsis sp. WQ 127309]UOZ11328.1 hypothetical protein MUY22_24895 [Amycolatopsis sp. WQ 127309]
MFGTSKEQKNLEALLDRLARSYLRGAVMGTPEGRRTLCAEIGQAATAAQNNGKHKVIAEVRAYRPAFLGALPLPHQREFEELRSAALKLP